MLHREMPKYLNSQISHVIDEVVHNKRDRDILKMKFIDGETDNAIADKYNLTVRGVTAIVSRNFDDIF